MSQDLLEPITFIRNTLNQIDPDFREWTDAFNFDNIPENLIDHSYHIFVGLFNGGSLNDLTLNANQAYEVRLFRRGFRDAASGRDEAIREAGRFVLQAINPANLTGFEVLKEMSVTSINPIARETNDNLTEVVITMNARLILCPT
jgi:hypothetical protein